jgi:hypothetical protein
VCDVPVGGGGGGGVHAELQQLTPHKA